MTWLTPGMAWFGLLIPAVLALWFLKIKRRDVTVSSTLLWAKVLEDKRVNSPFQRFRKSLVLLMQLLVLALVTLALMQPERRGEEVAGRVHILLVDTSASMGVDESGGTRLAQAKERARERIENIGWGERAVIIAFDHSARAVSPVTDDGAVLRRSLDALRPGITSTRIGPAIELALSIAARQNDAVAVIYSDGNFQAWEGTQIPLPLEFEPVGETDANAGITALSARPELGVEGKLRIFVEVRNPGSRPAPGTLSLNLGGNPVRVSTNEGIPPGERWSHPFELETPAGGRSGGEVLEVVWSPEGRDRLEADDRAWIVVEPPAVVDVWQVGPPNFALDDALAVLPHTHVHTMSVDAAKEKLAESDVDLPDVIVWDRTAPDALPAGPAHLFLGALPPGVWDPEIPLTERPPVISWDDDHPLNRFVSYSALDGEIPEAWILPDIPNSRALLDSRGGGLIRTFRTSTAHGIVVSFDPMKTRWPLRTGFPFFLQAATAFLGRPVEAVEGIRPGDLITIDGGSAVEEYRVTDPAGSTKVVEASADGWFRSAETDQLGLYTVRWRDPRVVDAQGTPIEWTRVVPVSLLSLEESTILPAKSIAIAGSELTEESANRTLARQIFWPWLLALGLVFLMAEWFFYHRR